jgi:acetylornithine deacetylase
VITAQDRTEAGDSQSCRHRSRWERPSPRRPEVRGVPFGTDAGPLNAGGTPCIVFGPGDIAQAHTHDEWIDLEQVQRAAEAYYQIAVDLGSADIR